MDVRGWGENATTVALPGDPEGSGPKMEFERASDAPERAAHHKASKSHGAHGAGAGELECVINSVQCHDRFRQSGGGILSRDGEKKRIRCVCARDHRAPTSVGISRHYYCYS